MSLPSIPEINIGRLEAINMLIASIGMEQIALAHILNAEGEKIQYVLGTLKGQSPLKNVSICDIYRINESVNKTIENVIETEIMLQFKLEDAIKLSSKINCER